MPIAAAIGTCLIQVFTLLPGNGKIMGNNPCRHRYDGIAYQHHNRCYKLTQGRHRRDVAVTYRSDGDNRPVNTLRDIRKTIFPLFHQVHDGTQYHRQHQHRQQKNTDFTRTVFQGILQIIYLQQEMPQFKYPEYTQQAQSPEHQQRLCPHKKHSEIRRNQSQQINDAQHTEHILRRPADTDEAQDIFYGKENGEQPFQLSEQHTMRVADTAHTVQHHNHNTGKDGNQQGNIKSLSRQGVRLIDYLVQTKTPILFILYCHMPVFF